MSKTISIGKRRIGGGQPCFIAAEIGINHNGNMKLARRMIDAAAAAGADAVKFQNYRTEDFILDRSLTYEYKSQGRRIKESQFEMFKRCELSTSQLRQLCAHCRKRGVLFFSTPTSGNGIAELVRLGSPLLKNGSDYLTHLPLIRAMAKTRLPTVLSTGMATLAEIKAAVRAFRKAGGKKLILLHCTSSYPTPAADVHLRKIPALAAAFGCLTGLSDHTDGIAAAIGAVTLGACFIEKHFTLNKNLPGPDHYFSADPAEFRKLVQAVRFTEQALGTAAIGPTASEMAGRKNFRLSCVASGNFSAGHVLTQIDVAFCRPATGLPPAKIERLIGCKLRRRVKIGEVFNGNMFESKRAR
jgi:N-acetylneuraminate synthase/N,N'-diacetyllegionaminate synthase